LVRLIGSRLSQQLGLGPVSQGSGRVATGRWAQTERVLEPKEIKQEGLLRRYP
jgi:hypothetical protein